jgi:hypothetical protein
MRTAEEVRDYLKKRKKKKGKKRPWVSFKEGTYYIRIGKPWRKKGEVWKDVLFHGGWKNKVYCAKNDIDEETGKQRKCIVCRRLAELKTDRSKRGKKLWSLINQRSEGLWNLLVAKRFTRRNDGSVKVKRYEDNKFKIWRASYKWHNALVDIFSDDDYRIKSILGVTHPKYGRLIRLKREGSGRDDTAYTFKVLEKMSPISKSEETTAKFVDTLVNLDKVVSGSTDEELAAFLRRMEKKAKIQARRDEEEEEDEDDDDVDEDEDEVDDEDDDRPRKKKKHRSDEDEDEEDDDDEDDLDRQYKKMKKGIKKKKRRKEEDEDDEED